MHRWSPCLVLIALLTAGPSAADDAAKLFSRIEMRGLPEPIAAQRIADAIADIVLLRHPSGRQASMFPMLAETLEMDPASPPRTIAAEARARLAGLLIRRPVEEDDESKGLKKIKLVSKPHAAGISGFCRSDIYLIYFRPPGGSTLDTAAYDKGPDMTVEPARFVVTPAYRALVAPSSAIAKPADAAERAANATACAKLDPAKDTFTTAYSDADAARGAWLYQELKAGFAMKALPFDIDCKDWATPATCRALIAGELSGMPNSVSFEPWESFCTFDFPHVHNLSVHYDTGSTPKILDAGLPYRFPPAPTPPRKS